ncbi:hypothetical protein AC579_8437 [Pseudocercospora musae]|uniref:Uncharacterized protein n=1 Tax=Pseudocercospora musae TaxID=113226 RepID=A0A139I3W1_9PEZI|nr:hypothetical protein AC579_8437 [Pseudocercospora musae]KXT09417.1 hypothetical protein AC579_8437 [Pseudocercospora musae]
MANGLDAQIHKKLASLGGSFASSLRVLHLLAGAPKAGQEVQEIQHVQLRTKTRAQHVHVTLARHPP